MSLHREEQARSVPSTISDARGFEALLTRPCWMKRSVWKITPWMGPHGILARHSGPHRVVAAYLS